MYATLTALQCALCHLPCLGRDVVVFQGSARCFVKTPWWTQSLGWIGLRSRDVSQKYMATRSCPSVAFRHTPPRPSLPFAQPPLSTNPTHTLRYRHDQFYTSLNRPFIPPGPSVRSHSPFFKALLDV